MTGEIFFFGRGGRGGGGGLKQFISNIPCVTPKRFAFMIIPVHALFHIHTLRQPIVWVSHGDGRCLLLGQ